MRKLKLFFACLLMAVLSIGQMWATTYKLTKVTSVEAGKMYVFERNSHVFANMCASSALRTTDSYKTTGLEGTESYVWTLETATGGFYLKNVSLASNPYLNNASKTTVSFGAASSIWTIAFTGEVALISNTSNSNRFLGDAGKDSPNNTYKAYATSNLNDYQHDITVYVLDEEGSTPPTPAKTLESVAVSGTPTKTSYTAGEDFDPAGLTVMGHYSEGPDEAITSGITWSYNPAQVLDENQTSIKVKATVSDITSEDWYVVGNLTVAAAPAPTDNSYEKVTSAPEDWSGEYLLVYENGNNAHVWTGVDAANCYVSATISSNVITKPEGAVTLTIAKEGTGYSLLINGGTNDGKYLTDNTSNAALKFATTAYAATFSYESNWTKILFSQRCIRFNNGTNSGMRFRYYAATSQQPIQLYKKATASLPSAELAFADANHLVKFGDAFTAPELTNPHSVAVTYASSNTNVAEVASNGAVTIKALGVSVITASFAGNNDYKAGSASYTICVVNHLGTEADPFDVADARRVIDAFGTKEGVYMSGIVSQITTPYDETYHNISFDISTDGTPTADQVRAYRCKGLDNTDFTSEDDVKTGATVTVYGDLKKYNSTYEFDAGCYLKAYEAPAVPKTHIANTKETAYTVAQAIAYAADGVTYDLDDYVYVQGVVYDVKSFNNGAMNIFIKDANAENQFELYKCAGINDGNATTQFEALTDVQAGNIVIGYGQLTVYNTTYEFKQGNYLVDIQKPATGIELDATAEVEAGSTVNLTATILPSNATGTIVWSVESGDAYASVDGGVVTGIAEGEAVIRATVQGTEIYAECTVTVTPEAAPVSYDYALVTDAAQLQDGLKVIIVAAEEDKAAGSAASTYRYVVDVERTTDGNYLILDSENMPTEFTLGVSGENFTLNDGNGYMYESAVKSVKVREEAFEWTISIGDGNIATIGAPNGDLRYNSGSPRFTTYASGQQALQLYVKNDGKQAAGLAWSASEVELTVGDPFEAPTLTNPNNLVVTITSDNEDVATVSEGIVSLVADATGTAKITASYAGDETYRAASVSYTITVNPAPVPAETKNIVILAEYNSKFYAMTNSLSSGALAAVEVEKDGSNIVVSSAEDKAAIQWTATVEGENTTLMDANNKYIKGSNGASLSLDDAAYIWNWDGEKLCYISSEYTTRGLFFNNSGVFKGYATSNLTNDAYAATEVIEIDPENIVVTSKVDPQLAYTPAEVTLTVVDAFTPATLTYVEGFDGLEEVTYASNNEAVATVDESGVVSLVADAIGTATITATFAGNNNYLAGSASYTITVNEAGDDLSGSWVLATAVPAVGQKVIIAATYQNETKAVGIQNSNNRAAVASTLEDDVLTPGAGTKVFTLVDAGDGKFAIQASNGNYLSAAGTGTSNFLKEAENFDEDNAKWTITIENGEANIVASSNNRNVLRYNSGNTIFSCYQSGAQRAINIYVQDTYTRALEPNRYYTVCLPKKMMEVRGASFWTLSSRNEAGSMAYLEEVDPTTAEAGTPFIIQATDTKLEVVYTGAATTTAGTNGALHGTLSDMDYDDLSAAGNVYLLIQNFIRPLASGNYLNANRAYIDYEALNPVTEAPQPAPGRRVRAVPMQQNTATGIDELNGSEAPAKVLINGQLFILRGEKMYDVKGQLVK